MADDSAQDLETTDIQSTIERKRDPNNSHRMAEKRSSKRQRHDQPPPQSSTQDDNLVSYARTDAESSIESESPPRRRRSHAQINIDALNLESTTRMTTSAREFANDDDDGYETRRRTGSGVGSERSSPTALGSPVGSDYQAMNLVLKSAHFQRMQRRNPSS